MAVCEDLAQRNDHAIGRSKDRMVFDPILVQEIIKSDKFLVVDLAQAYHGFSDQLDVDFNGAVALFEALPVFLNGEAHGKQRKAMAMLLAHKRAESEKSVREAVNVYVDALFVPGASFDLVSDLCRPIYAALSEAFIEDDEVLPELRHEIPQLFGTTMPFNRRKQLSAEISTYISSGTIHSEDRRTRLGLLALGHDTLIGTLALSLAWVFEGHLGVKICDCKWPESLALSSLPYVDRVASTDCDVQGCHFKRGERVRLYLADKPCPAAGGDQSLIFGKGSHSCLGKPISNFIWLAIVEKMKQIQLSVSINSVELRSPDTLFHFPRRIEVTVDG